MPKLMGKKINATLGAKAILMDEEICPHEIQSENIKIEIFKLHVGF